ncbi:HK97-gp10 family putative phage morphogenesis protein [Janibacter sp. LM]|uniref:HK97-gp10 family putative phage morphogenesis protein n=1 Tax=Janibacter sp. LM TaxID=3144845 RepID=UPI0031F6FF64
MATTDGLTQYQGAMRLASATVGARAATATRKTGAAITRDAKIGAPVDTGNLRASLGMLVTGDGRTGRMAVSIGPTAAYGKYVEQGTSRMAAQPYLAPATARHVPGWHAALTRINTPDGDLPMGGTA